MANEGSKFLKYGRHVKSEGKPATYKEHMNAKSKALKKRTETTGSRKKDFTSEGKQGN